MRARRAATIAQELGLVDDEDPSGLILPAELEQERKVARARAEAEKVIERRRHGKKADRLVRRDGKVRKGAHTQSATRARANRKRGLKGIAGG